MTRCWWIAILALFLFGCSALSGGPESGSAGGGLESAAYSELEKWAKNNGTPYQNAQMSILKNDGTYATVKVVAELPGAPSAYFKQEATTDCRKVEQKWQCDPNWQGFRLSDASVNATVVALCKGKECAIGDVPMI